MTWQPLMSVVACTHWRQLQLWWQPVSLSFQLTQACRLLICQLVSHIRAQQCQVVTLLKYNHQTHLYYFGSALNAVICFCVYSNRVSCNRWWSALCGHSWYVVILLWSINFQTSITNWDYNKPHYVEKEALDILNTKLTYSVESPFYLAI